MLLLLGLGSMPWKVGGLNAWVVMHLRIVFLRHLDVFSSADGRFGAVVRAVHGKTRHNIEAL